MTKNITIINYQVITIMLFLLAVVNVCAEPWAYHRETKINWRQYDKYAFAEAKDKNKPLYIFVYSDECSWCRKFETESLEKQSIRTILEKEFIPVAIDLIKQPELAKNLKVKLVPGNLLLTPGREKLLKFYGFIKEQALYEVLGKTLKKWRQGVTYDNEFGDEKTCCPISY